MKGVNAFDPGDALVVGGGLSGLLIADRLAEVGISCTVLERDSLGAEQSSHSHGYLHSGCIYLDVKRDFVDALREARGEWQSILADLNEDNPVRKTSSIGFHNPFTADAAYRRWQEFKLPVRRGARPDGFRPALTTWFESDEPTYDFTPVLSGFGRRLRSRGVRFLRGSAEGLVLSTDKRTVTGVHVTTPAGAYVARPTCVVLAAGTGNVRLITSSMGFPGLAVERQSFMLVLASSELPITSAVLPDPETGGLFIVSRRHDDGTPVWLVSDFVSLHGSRSSDVERSAWARGMLAGLRRWTDVLDLAALRAGMYRAPKAELRPDPRRLGVHAIDTYGLANFVAVSPTKLTFVPSLARAAVTQVAAVVTRGRRRHAAVPLETGADLAIHPEHWRGVALQALEDFGTIIAKS